MVPDTPPIRRVPAFSSVPCYIPKGNADLHPPPPLRALREPLATSAYKIIHHVTPFVRDIPALQDTTLEPPIFIAHNSPMKINTQIIEPHESHNRLPRATGGGVSVPADGGGLPPFSPPSPPSPPQSQIPDPQSLPPLSAALTRDLLDPTISALDLCDYHELNLIELQAIINSNDFQRLKAAIEEINTARQALIQPEARTAALAALNELTRRPIDSQQAAETARKAATKLEQLTRPTATRPPARKATYKAKQRTIPHQQTLATHSSPRPLTIPNSIHPRPKRSPIASAIPLLRGLNAPTFFNRIATKTAFFAHKSVTQTQISKEHLLEQLFASMRVHAPRISGTVA
jgi:hypothetical protein